MKIERMQTVIFFFFFPFLDITGGSSRTRGMNSRKKCPSVEVPCTRKKDLKGVISQKNTRGHKIVKQNMAVRIQSKFPVFKNMKMALKQTDVHEEKHLGR